MNADICAGALLAGIAGGGFAIYSWFKTRQTQSAMKAHSYQEIATNWHLWDEFVNYYFYTETPTGVLRGEGDPIDFNPKANPKMKSRPMNYDDFYNCPTDEKIEALKADFGERV